MWTREKERKNEKEGTIDTKRKERKKKERREKPRSRKNIKLKEDERVEKKDVK